MSGIKTRPGTLPQSAKRLNITPVILAGGQGLRLRPLTGKDRPKPFLKPFARYSLFQQTALRAGSFLDPVVVCERAHALRAFDELAELGIAPHKIICEPEGRSTAAAIAMAAFYLKDSPSPMIVMPSDHYIESAGAFRKTTVKALQLALVGGVVVLGSPPRKPESRYGYVSASGTFTEKPSPVKARELFSRQDTFWNTGIFVCRPERYLGLLETHEPDVFTAVHKAFLWRGEKELFLHPHEEAYVKTPSISVDYAVMERCADVKVMPLETQWRDIGCWQALLDVKLRTLGRKIKGF